MMAEEGRITGDDCIAVCDIDTGQFFLTRFVASTHMAEVLVEAGSTFDSYASNHYAKSPPQREKAARNVAMAEKCFSAAGKVYVPPSESADRPNFRPVEPSFGSECSGGTFTGPKALLRAVYDGIQAEQPLKSLDMQMDDRIALMGLVEMGFATVDELSDAIGITTSGRDSIGIRPEGVAELPVEVAEVTGNIAEGELAARYLDGKVAAVDNAIALHRQPENATAMSWVDAYQHIALIFRETAREFRMGLHLPTVHIDGRVIPYNEDRSTGIKHADTMRSFFEDVYSRNLKAGWWTDIETGLPKKRSVGELFMLFVTEIAEAYEAWSANAADDKLPDYPGLGVELADLGIRWADFCGAYLAGNIIGPDPANNPGDRMFQEVCMIARHYEAIRKTPEAKGEPETADHLPPADVATMIDSKLAFNAKREDHKIENRLKEDGKRT
jgi:hypothetical protein